MVDFAHINKLVRVLSYDEDTRTAHWGASRSKRKLYNIPAQWIIAARRIMQSTSLTLRPSITVGGEISPELGMKIWQTIVIYDYCVVAETAEDAREVLVKWAHGHGGTETPVAPTEYTAREIRDEREIRNAMREAKPLVGDSVTDADFEKLVKGKTNLVIFKSLHTKTAAK